MAETDLFISKLDAQRQKFLDDDLTSIISRGIPDGQYDKMLTMARANILYFIADDYFESTSKEIKNIFKATLSFPSTGLEYQQYVRLSYQWLRKRYFFFAFARYAVGIYLSDEQLDDPLCTMENDIVSYQKELDNQTHSDGILPLNLVATILAHGVDGRQFTTPLEAKLFLREEIERYEEILYGALSVALSDMDKWKNLTTGGVGCISCRILSAEYMVRAIYSPLQPSGKTGVEKDYSCRGRGGLH
ncbi:hypothetical protein B0H13DRAFT_2011092 [Mycena leptocephala]|nr:hypothetical protein B0H13DRAFT_2011092 [Mycena leptocephala]